MLPLYVTYAMSRHYEETLHSHYADIAAAFRRCRHCRRCHAKDCLLPMLLFAAIVDVSILHHDIITRVHMLFDAIYALIDLRRRLDACFIACCSAIFFTL